MEKADMPKIQPNSKRNLILMAAALAMAGAFSIPSASAEGYRVARTARVVGVASWDYLNIRKWPAYYSAKVGRATPHAEVWIERCVVKRRSSDWCKISWMHQRGWVNSRYLVPK
jgi:uncharacterized protein YraI